MEISLRKIKREIKRKKILQAAKEIFLKHGYHASTMDMVAERAGFSKGLVYFYFESKDRLLAFLIKETFEDFVSELESLKALTLSAEEKLSEFIEKTLRFFIENRSLFKLLYSLISGYELQRFEPEYREVFTSIHNRMLNVLESILEEGRLEGKFKDIAPETLKFFVSGPLHLYIIFGPEPENLDKILKEFKNLIFTGLKRS